MMLKVVSDNSGLYKIERMGFTQIGLNREENSQILLDYPQDEFLRATAQYQFCMDHVEDIEEDLRPSLKTQLEGPFTLAIYNHGESLARSMLVFEIQPAQDKPPSEGIVVDDQMDWTARSIAVLPFVDVFRSHIDKEAHRAAQLIRSSKVTNMSESQARKDADQARTMMESFVSILQSKKKQKETGLPEGKEVVSDVLSTSLSAQKGFYHLLWGQMTEFFEPSFRHLGERHALGKESLESPTLISPK